MTPVKTIQISETLHRKLKLFCATYGYIINNIAQQAIEESLVEYEKAERLRAETIFNEERN